SIVDIAKLRFKGVLLAALKPSSLNNTLDVLKAFTRWASSKNINSFSRLTPFNITDYINYLQKDKKLSPKVIHQYILCIDRIYKLRDHLNCSFSFKPWKGSAKQAAGNNDDQNESKTIPFTIKEASQLFNTSLLIIKKSEHYLSIRDEIHTDRKFKNPHQKNKHARKILSNYGIKSLLELNRYLVDIPAASYIIIALTTGCRAHEILDIRLDCLRKTTYHSEVFYWLHSYSYKANIGSTRWLAPGILLEVIEILE
uniref:phage integrase SAM-like domain-containing protein n=1 Tax=Pseudomonas sp. TaxID=306 RepID=UPI0028A94C3E